MRTPRFYRGSLESFLDYLKLFNVHAVVVWHKDVLSSTTPTRIG